MTLFVISIAGINKAASGGQFLQGVKRELSVSGPSTEFPSATIWWSYFQTSKPREAAESMQSQVAGRKSRSQVAASIVSPLLTFISMCLDHAGHLCIEPRSVLISRSQYQLPIELELREQTQRSSAPDLQRAKAESHATSTVRTS
jgi:hypothetical protein